MKACTYSIELLLQFYFAKYLEATNISSDLDFQLILYMSVVKNKPKRKDHYKVKVYGLFISDIFIFSEVGNAQLTLGFLLFLSRPSVM